MSNMLRMVLKTARLTRMHLENVIFAGLFGTATSEGNSHYLPTVARQNCRSRTS
jgi:hypothetical protein